jgi:hypothetical protein
MRELGGLGSLRGAAANFGWTWETDPGRQAPIGNLVSWGSHPYGSLDCLSGNLPLQNGHSRSNSLTMLASGVAPPS